MTGEEKMKCLYLRKGKESNLISYKLIKLISIAYRALEQILKGRMIRMIKKMEANRNKMKNAFNKNGLYQTNPISLTS